MKFIVSCVEKASVQIPQLNIERKIWKWLLVYVGISKEDFEKENIISQAVSKLLSTKFIYDPSTDKISLSVSDINWEILLISNFTLYGKCKKGTKIDFSQAGKFNLSKQLYEKLVEELSQKIKLQTGEFWAYMIVSSENAWPLNYVLEI